MIVDSDNNEENMDRLMRYERMSRRIIQKSQNRTASVNEIMADKDSSDEFESNSSELDKVGY